MGCIYHSKYFNFFPSFLCLSFKFHFIFFIIIFLNLVTLSHIPGGKLPPLHMRKPAVLWNDTGPHSVMG